MPSPTTAASSGDYYTNFTLGIAYHPVVTMFLFGILVGYFVIAAYGKNEVVPAPVEFFKDILVKIVIIFLVLGYFRGNSRQFLSTADVYVGTFSGLLTGIVYYLSALVYVPLFGILHLGVPIVMLCAAPAFIRGFHFLFVPHPAQPYVTPVVRGEGTPAPLNMVGIANVLEYAVRDRALGFVNRNMARKAAKLSEKLRKEEERLREETRLADATLDYERARAAHADRKR